MRDLWKLQKTSMDKNRSDSKYSRLYRTVKKLEI